MNGAVCVSCDLTRCCIVLLVPAILSKYDLLQPQTIEKDYRLQKNRQQWAQFRNDLNNTLHWLDDAERHMANQKVIPTSTLKLVKAINDHKVCTPSILPLFLLTLK